MSFLQYLFFFKLFRSIPLHYNNAIMNVQALANLCTADSREFIRLVRKQGIIMSLHLHFSQNDQIKNDRSTSIKENKLIDFPTILID